MVLEYLKLDLGPCRKLLPAKIPDSRHFKGQDRTYPNFKKNKKNICRKTSIKTRGAIWRLFPKRSCRIWDRILLDSFDNMAFLS